MASPSPPHLQPCFSLIWDTALLTNALIEAGVSQDHPLFKGRLPDVPPSQDGRGLDHLLTECRTGGWYFQFENELYPDVDDSAVVIMALSKLKISWGTGM